jgi:hypothetical protein
MSDIFRQEMNSRCGIGGLKCYCCNVYHGKERKLISRSVRRVQKDRLNKELFKIIAE